MVARNRVQASSLEKMISLFVREAQSLAKLDHPNIVAVHQVFKDNGTAYMALDHIDGCDLLDLIENPNITMSPDDIVKMADKLLSAVSFVHENDMLHRDISPDNILIRAADNNPILIDFGATRENMSDESRTLTAHLSVKDGYSPQEFYIAGATQTPSSDLYSLAATLYHLIVGQPPTNSQERIIERAEGRPDSCQILAGQFAGYPVGFLENIDKAMQVIPKDRIQSVAEWRSNFGQNATVPQVKRKRPMLASVGGLVAVAGAAYFMVPSFSVNQTISSNALEAPTAFMAATTATVAPEILSTATLEEDPELPIALKQSGGFVEPTIITDALSTASTLLSKRIITTATVSKDVIDNPTTYGHELNAQIAVNQQTPIEAIFKAEPAKKVAAQIIQPPAPVEPEVVVENRSKVSAMPVSAQQVSLAVWDVRIPFAEAYRVVDGRPAIVISRVNPTIDLSVAGDWIVAGLKIIAVNNQPIQPGATIAGSILGQIKVDPDGFSRVAINYIDKSGATHTRLLAIETVRMVSLVNGVNLITEHVEGEWQTTVQSIAPDADTTLRVNDQIFRDKFSGFVINGSDSIENIMQELIDQNVGATVFSVLRGNRIETATMPLVFDKS